MRLGVIWGKNMSQRSLAFRDELCRCLLHSARAGMSWNPGAAEGELKMLKGQFLKPTIIISTRKIQTTKSILTAFFAALVFSYLYKKHQLTHLADVTHTGSCSGEAGSFSSHYSGQPAHSGVFRYTRYIWATLHHLSHLLFPFTKASIKNTNIYSMYMLSRRFQHLSWKGGSIFVLSLEKKSEAGRDHMKEGTWTN